MTWILVLSLYSPGGDHLESSYFRLWDERQCLDMARRWRGRDALGVRYRAECIARKAT